MRVAQAPADDVMRSPAVSRLRMALVVVAGGCALASGASGVHAETAGTTGAAGAAPAICIEADASALDPGAWAEVLAAIELATDQKPDFFPDATVVSVPDLTEPWEAADTPTIRIGIWATASDAPDSAGDGQQDLAASDCLADGAGWTTTISGELLQAGAERILAGARLPDDSGSPPIREDAEAAIAVDLDPAEGRVRTTLQFDVPVGPLRLGGRCWIDDALGIDGATGDAVTRASTGMDVDPFTESACQKFAAFMTDGGAGEQALSLLPTAISLGDGTVARFVARSAEVSDRGVVMSGTIHTPSDAGPGG